MISICYTPQKHSVCIRGHANFAPFGEDIVCAGISGAANLLLRWAQSDGRLGANVDMEAGRISLKLRPALSRRREADGMLSCFFEVCADAAKIYPENIEVREER